MCADRWPRHVAAAVAGESDRWQASWIGTCACADSERLAAFGRIRLTPDRALVWLRCRCARPETRIGQQKWSIVTSVVVANPGFRPLWGHDPFRARRLALAACVWACASTRAHRSGVGLDFRAPRKTTRSSWFRGVTANPHRFAWLPKNTRAPTGRTLSSYSCWSP